MTAVAYYPHMTTTHTYTTPKGRVYTRKSKTRHYKACVALTLTQKVLTKEADRLNRTQEVLARKATAKGLTTEELVAEAHAAKTEWQRQGLKNPKGEIQGIIEAAAWVEVTLKDASLAAGEHMTTPGDQEVQSWHATVLNAQKALQNRHYTRLRALGYNTTVETNIETT